MQRARIRFVERISKEMSGAGIPELREQIEAQCPPGFMAVSAPYRKSPGENEDAMQVTATYERRDSMREIEGETREELDAQVPEGWQVLGIWRD